MGAVYVALEPQLGRRVALKLQLAAVDAQEALRFAAEGATAARLQHPGIVRVHTMGVDQGRPYLVMDLVEGESAQARIERVGALPPDEAVAIVRAVGAALAFAHERGVVHRDLKPHNVLLGPAGPVLTDFGLARDLRRETLTRTGEGAGTPAFMAPEQAEDMKRAGPLADVYGLGATLYALLAGRPPFVGATPVNVLKQVLHDPPPPLDVDPDLETICRTCLAKDPGDRYASVGALLEDLARWSAGEPIAARRPRGPRMSPGARRVALALAGALGLAVAGLALGPSWRAGREPVSRADVQRLIASGDVAAAISALDEAVALEPEASELRALRGGLRLESGDVQGGADDLSFALALAPDDAEALTRRAEALRALGDQDGLERDLARLHALRPGNVAARRELVAVRLARADDAYARGDLDLSVAACTSALAVDPQHARALALRAMARWESSAVEPADDQAALADLEQALARDPRLAWAHAQIARIHLAWPNGEAALPAARRAEELEATPAHVQGRIAAELAFLVEQRRRLESMAALGVRADPRDAARLDQELERLEQELRRTPLDGEGLALLAELRWARRRPGEALEIVERALTAAPTSPRVRVLRCRLLGLSADLERTAAAVCDTILVGDRPENRARRRWILRQLDRELVEAVSGAQVDGSDLPRQAAASRGLLRVQTGNVAAGLEDLDAAGALQSADYLQVRAELTELHARTRDAPGFDGRWAAALFGAAARRLREGAREEARDAARRALELSPALAGFDHPVVRAAR